MLTNPRPQSIRLLLSDGSERIVGPWGLAVLAEYNRLGQLLEVISAELLDAASLAASPVPVEASPTREHAA
jgi:hypothetical protein